MKSILYHFFCFIYSLISITHITSWASVTIYLYVVLISRNIIHGSDGPETAKDEINLWFKPEELVNYTNNAEKWVYGEN